MGYAFHNRGSVTSPDGYTGYYDTTLRDGTQVFPSEIRILESASESGERKGGRESQGAWTPTAADGAVAAYRSVLTSLSLSLSLVLSFSLSYALLLFPCSSVPYCLSTLSLCCSLSLPPSHALRRFSSQPSNPPPIPPPSGSPLLSSQWLRGRVAAAGRGLP